MDFLQKIFIKKPKQEILTMYYNCSDISLFNWIKYLESQDLRYFNAEFKESKENKNAMESVFGEYIELTENRTIISRFGKMHKIMKLDGKYKTVSLLIRALYNYKKECGMDIFNDLIKQLEAHNYKIDKSKDIFKQLENINSRIQGLKTQIELIEIEINKDDGKEKTNLESEIITVGRILELKYKIEPKETTLKEWIELCKQAKTTAKNGK